ncbi:hypothetical protein [Halorubrum halophilum]|uniref:hypothetical protein n=1 Tax=Halorubrum halophilum TaxID=413816 RepID=UPI00067921CC|nr:hypothetical protein [Halorubrum halophilum]
MDRPRLTALLIWAVVGTYLLLALGATAATDAGSAIDAVHHAAAVAVGVLLAAAALLAHRTAASRGVRLGTIGVLIAYAAQAGVEPTGHLETAAATELANVFGTCAGEASSPELPPSSSRPSSTPTRGPAAAASLRSDAGISPRLE